MGWIRALIRASALGDRIGDGEEELGGRYRLAVHEALAVGGGDAATDLRQLGADFERVARGHGLAELHLVGAHEEHDLRGFIGGPATQHDEAGGLRHGFDLQHAWHDRLAREVALEVGLVDRDVLDRHEGVVGQLDHTVHHHEGVAVGEGVEDLADVEGVAEGGLRGIDFLGRFRLGLGVLGLLPLLADGGGEAGVERVAWADGDDVGLEADAGEDDVADDIEDLVADEFILEAQRLLADDLVALEDDGRVERPALDEALFEEFFDVLVDGERAGRGDLRFVGLGIDVDREVLRVDAAVIRRGAGDAQAIEGQGDDRAAALVDRDRLREREDFAFVGLIDDARLMDERRERTRGAVDDRRFGGIEFDDGVVDAHAAERGEHVLDRVQLDGVGGDGRLALQVGDHFRDRPDLGFAEKVDAAEDEAGVGGARFEGQGDLLAGVEGLAFDRGFFSEGALFHAVPIVIHTPLAL